MEQSQITVSARDLGEFDVAVAGGGVAGVAAAVTAAKHGCRVVLIEGCGCLGGALTAGLVPNMSLDREGKGGIVAEFFRFMDEHGFTCPRRGNTADEAGDPLPGGVVSPDGAKILFDIWCREAGVTTLLYSYVIGVEMDGRSIRRLFLGSECGPAVVRAKVYVDATGNGTLSRMAGCRGEFGDPENGRPQPATLGFTMSGLDLASSTVDKTAYGEELAATGVRLSNRRPCALKLPDMHNVLVWSNYAPDVRPDDILSLTSATMHAREECLAVAEAHRAISAHRRARLGTIAEHLGIREGYRIAGLYRLTLDDLRNGSCFDDGICPVSFGVDVHDPDRSAPAAARPPVRPYQIPYRALVPEDADNLLLCGRLLSGDFHAHASYRVICNMMTVGEAVGRAAKFIVDENISPRSLDGRRVNAYMRDRGYQLQGGGAP